MQRATRLLQSLFDPKAPKIIKVLCATALIYLAFPLDFVPDLIPIIGWIDDGVAVLGLLTLAASKLPTKLPGIHPQTTVKADGSGRNGVKRTRRP